MSEPPDFISLSAWSANPPNTKLNTIVTVSHLPTERIFVGEWGCRISSPARASCFSNHATAAFRWGVRLWFVWAYADGGGGGSDELVDSQSGADTPNGFSVLDPLNARWYRRF